MRPLYIGRGASQRATQAIGCSLEITVSPFAVRGPSPLFFSLDRRQSGGLDEVTALALDASILDANGSRTSVKLEQSSNVSLWCLENFDLADVDV